VAAFLLAVTHLHCRDSHFGVTDVTMTLGTTFALWLILRTASMASLWRFALCGGAIGLAAAAKQPAIFAFAPLLVAAFAPTVTATEAPATTTTRGGSIRRGLAAAAVAALAAVVVFLALNPFILSEPRHFLDDMVREFKSKSEASESEGARGWIVHARFTLWLGLGAPYAIAALLGAIVMAIRRRPGEGALLAFALAYYACMGSGTRAFARYMIPLTPLAALFAARAITVTAEFLPDRRRVAATLLATAAIAAVSFCRVVATDRLLAARDTRLQTFASRRRLRGATIPASSSSTRRS
jgi:4-amino-4-deoxy-L-arabinose transferase-like glycosyltransferase